MSAAEHQSGRITNISQVVRADTRCFLPRLRPLLLLLSMISPLLIFKFRGYFTPVG